MSYVNETKGLDHYKIIGTITVPALSVGSNNTIRYRGKMSEALVGYGEHAIIPNIIIGESAITVTLVNVLGKPVDVFVAIITSVSRYEIDETTDNITIAFTYRRAQVAEKLRTTRTVEPVMSHILQVGSYIGILFEGNADYIQQYVEDNYESFYHGDVLYYTCNTYRVAERLEDVRFADVDRLPTGVILIASTLKLPSKEEGDVFRKRFIQFIGYGESKEA